MIDFIEQQSLNIITDITNSIKLQSKLYQINYIYQLIQHNQYARQLNKSHCTSIIDQLQEYNILHSSCIDQICSTSTSNTSSSSSSRGSSSSRRRSNNDNNAVCHTCKQQYILYNQYIAYYQTVQLSQRTDINTINPSDILIYSSYSTWANKQLQHELNDGCWAILSGNSNHIFADFTAAHPVGIDEDAPAPIYDNVTDESDQTSNNHILSIPYNKLWQLAWYNHSTIGKYYSHCPLMRNSATPTQALLQQKTVDTIQLSSDITGHNTSHKSKHHTNDNDEHNTE